MCMGSAEGAWQVPSADHGCVSSIGIARVLVQSWQAGAQPIPAKQGSAHAALSWEDKHHHPKRPPFLFLPHVLSLSMPPHAVGHPLGQFGPPVLAVSPPGAPQAPCGQGTTRGRTVISLTSSR